MKSAIVVVCVSSDSPEYWFRCPDCGSLNINGEETQKKCPDCQAEFAIPEVEFCDCGETE